MNEKYTNSSSYSFATFDAVTVKKKSTILINQSPHFSIASKSLMPNYSAAYVVTRRNYLKEIYIFFFSAFTKSIRKDIGCRSMLIVFITEKKTNTFFVVVFFVIIIKNRSKKETQRAPHFGISLSLNKSEFLARNRNHSLSSNI